MDSVVIKEASHFYSAICRSSDIDDPVPKLQNSLFIQVGLNFSREALYAIADQASEWKTGARGLRTIMVCTILLLS